MRFRFFSSLRSRAWYESRATLAVDTPRQEEGGSSAEVEVREGGAREGGPPHVKVTQLTAALWSRSMRCTLLLPGLLIVGRRCITVPPRTCHNWFLNLLSVVCCRFKKQLELRPLELECT